MTTVRDICDEALSIAGIVGDGQTASGAIINKTFSRFNRMLAQWQRERYKIWHLVENIAVGNGVKGGDGNPFTVGPAGDVNMTRPDRIEAAFLRQTIPSQPNNIDYPLEEMKSYEDWCQVALKSLKSFPSYFFYDSAMPLGKLYVWPVMSPAGLYETHIITKEVIGPFAALTTVLTTPPEYEAAYVYNLGRVTRAAFRKPKDEELNALAKEALNVLRKANTQVARLVMPNDLTRPGIYNVFSDQIR